MTRSVAAVAAGPGFSDQRPQIGRTTPKNSGQRPKRQNRSDLGTSRDAVPSPHPAWIRDEAGRAPTDRVAHDFNNLLGIITLNLELARARAGDGELREMIEEALGAAWRGSELTRHLAGM
jgi:hypothetical protein